MSTSVLQTCVWLYVSQVTRAEFALLWATYLAIMFTDLETGIGIGIVLATFYFAISYARVWLIFFPPRCCLFEYHCIGIVCNPAPSARIDN
jgi:hypothetical protein